MAKASKTRHGNIRDFSGGVDDSWLPEPWASCVETWAIIAVIAMALVGTTTTIRWAYGCAVDSARDFVKAEFRVRECMTQKDWAGRAQSEDDCRQGWR